MTLSTPYLELQEFRSNIVAPTLEEAEALPLKTHLVFALILAVDSYAARIFHAKQALGMAIAWPAEDKRRDDSAYREVLALENRDFGLLRDIAKASKHFKLDKGSPRVKSAEQISVKSLGYGIGHYGEGPYGGGPQIVVTDNDGKIRNVIALCRSALTFLDGCV